MMLLLAQKGLKRHWNLKILLGPLYFICYIYTFVLGRFILKLIFEIIVTQNVSESMAKLKSSKTNKK